MIVRRIGLPALLLIGACGNIAPALAAPLACDDGIKTAFRPDADTTVIAVRLIKKGEELASQDVPKPPITAAADLCLVKLLVGPGVKAEKDTTARSYSQGIGIEVWLPMQANWNERIRNYGGGGWVGVSVLRNGVRFTRPSRWQIRDASLEPGHSFVRYLSPDAYSFAIYERTDSPGKSWKDILEHYEADVTANGAKAIGQRVPMATATNQGRAYTIDRKIESKEPVLSRSREVLLRGEHRIVVVQIVTSEENLSRLSDQLLEILRRIEVL